MAQKELNLFQSACQRLRISRNGPITMLVMDGQGAALCTTGEFSPVQKWAQSKSAAPNGNLSAQKLLEKLEVLIVRPGTGFASTRGSSKPLGDLMKAMVSAGFDVNEWSIPNVVRNPPPEMGSPEAKKAAEQRAKSLAALDAKQSNDPPQGTS